MFHTANQLTAARKAKLYSNLEHLVGSLDVADSEWFDNTAQSVKARRASLLDAASQCRQASSSFDEDTAAELRVVAENLFYEASALSDIQQQLANEEYSRRIGSSAPKFSAEPLADESRTAASLETDWDLFMAIEPREFVAANQEDAHNGQEMHIRAFAFMDDATSGHGLSRSAKRQLTEEFLARVEHVRKTVAKTTNDQKVSSEVSFEDTAVLFF